MFKKRFDSMTPQKQLQFLTRVLIIMSILLVLLLFVSLVVTSSNLMIVNELNTESQFDHLSSQYPYYLTSQKVMIGLDVVLLLSVPLLIFSVFNFQQKGNLIIILFIGLLGLARQAGGLVFLIGSPELREGWNNLWDLADGGKNQLCLNECGDSVLNYVVCGKLAMWKQLGHYEIAFSIFFIILIVCEVLLAHFANKVDLKISSYAEQEITELNRDQ